jgi:methionine-rich copper-binding protein CopC
MEKQVSLRKYGGLLGGLILGLVALSYPVFAHSTLMESDPVPGQTVRGAIDEVDLVFWSSFSEPAIEVIRPDGESVAGQTSQVDGVTALFAMDHPVTEEGEYVVRYQVRSNDDDLVEGAFAFVYAPDSASRWGRATASLLAVLTATAILASWRVRARMRAKTSDPPEPA